MNFVHKIVIILLSIFAFTASETENRKLWHRCAEISNKQEACHSQTVFLKCFRTTAC